jgi:hypothetical protein
MVKLLDRICQPFFVMGSKVQGSGFKGLGLRASRYDPTSRVLASGFVPLSFDIASDQCLLLSNL